MGVFLSTTLMLKEERVIVSSLTQGTLGRCCISPVPSERHLYKGHTDQWCWGEPRSLIPCFAGGVAWLTPVLALLQSCHHTSPGEWPRRACGSAVLQKLWLSSGEGSRTCAPQTGGAHGTEDGQGLLWCRDWKENVCRQKPWEDFFLEALEELWVCCKAGGHEKWRRVVVVRMHGGWGRVYAQCLTSCFLLLQKLPCSSLWF